MTCGARLKLFTCCSMPAFLALVRKTEQPIAHPCLRLSIPFQYRIRLIAWETRGHHCTAPAWSFLHVFSACLLYSVAALSMASYCSCWLLVKRIFTSDANVFTLASRLSSFSLADNVLLYLVTTRGSLHCSRHAECRAIISVSTGQTHWVGMSSHSAR